MKVRRLQVTLVTLVAILGAVVVNGIQPAAAASTTTAAAVSPSCQGHQRLDWAHVLPPGGSLPWGITELCWDGSKAFTIYTHFDANGNPAPMPVNFYANAWVYRYDPWPTFAGRSSCDGPDGNGHVVPGDTWCRTQAGSAEYAHLVPRYDLRLPLERR